MVLEQLIKPDSAEKSPWVMFLYGILYSTIGLFLSLWVFSAHASIVMIFLTVMACIFLVEQTLKLEEKKDMEMKKESALLKEHGKALTFLMFLFLGFVFSFSFWYIVLPVETVNIAFASQTSTIASINQATFAATNAQGYAISSIDSLSQIVMNNLKVLFFCILFAVFYGAGAIFILAWNASVIGVAIGNFVRNAIASLTANLGAVGIANYFTTYSLGVLKYLTHGLFEIIAYFLAAMGAGIISIAVIKHDYNSPKFKQVLMDSIDLIVISIICLIIAGLIEVFITPKLFL